MPDTAGNSLATATALNLTSTAQSFPDLVTPINNDYYRFVLSNRSSLNLTLTGLDADANVELLDSVGNLVSVGGIPQRSTNIGNFSEVISTPLDPGTYFIRVSPGASIEQANYVLNISAQDNLLSTDLVWRYPGLTGIWTLDGTSFVSASLLSNDLPADWSVGGVGDFNRDGKTDIIWRNDSAALTDVWYMDGSTLLSSASIFPALGAGWTIGGTSDFNDDGFIDIVWRNELAAAVEVWYMNGTALLSSATIGDGSAGVGWIIGGVGDFNQDGDPDILWQNRDFPYVGFWLLDGVSIEAISSLAPPGAGWLIGGTADFNQDGNLDIVWRFLGPEGFVGGWLLNRTSFSEAFLLSQTVPDPLWVVEAPYNTYGEPIPIDLAGETTATAFDIGKNLAGAATYREQIGGTTDTDDFYQFSIGTDARVTLSLSDFTADLDLGLYDSSGTLIQASTNTGVTPESLVGLLAAGTYFIQVQPFDPTNLTTYALSINVNTPPVLVSNNVLTLSEQGSATLTNTVLRVTDGDNLPPELTFTLGALPANGALLVNGVTATAGNTFTQANVDNNQIRYIHNGSETTNDRFTFTVSDNSGGAIGTTTFTIAVTPVNDPPTVVSNLGLTLAEGAVANISIALLQFTDVDSPIDGLSYSLTALPTNGTLLLAGTAITSFTQADLASGNLSYQHNGSETLSDRFTFTVSDGAGGVVTSTFTIGVTPVNDPPVLATNLALTLSEGQANSILAALLQITDPDNAPESLIYSVASLPTNGTLLLSGTAVTSFTQADVISGNLSYQHNGSETVSDRFTFTITDGLIPTPIGLNTFTINVIPVNDPPVVAVNAGLTLSEGTSALITPTRLQATDPEGQTPIIYTLDSLPTNGVVRLGSQTLLVGQTFTQADITNNQVAYIHNDTQTTTDSFQFSVVDAAGAIAPSSTFSITILAVNDAPVLTLPTGTQTIDQETNTLISGIRVTDVDLGTGEITVTLAAGNGVLSLGRTTGITFLAGDGTEDETLSFRGAQDVTNFVLQSLIYRSDNNFRGNDTINVTVSDGGNTGLGGPLSTAGALTLNVAPVNDAPVLTVPGAQTVREDTTTSISGISIADPDAGTSPVRVSLFVANGTLSLTSTSGITFSTGDGSSDKALVFEGALGDVNRVLGGLSYLGDSNFNGSDTLTISVSDSLNGGNGIPLSDTETIALTVTPVNDAPVLTVPSAQQVTENTDLRITGINVTDVDATGELTVNLFASSGRLSLNSTTGLTFDLGDGTQDDILAFRGTQVAVNDALRTLIYRANTDFNGNDTIAINVSDGGSTGLGGVLGDAETIAVTVLGVNNAPTITIPTTTPTVDSDTALPITGISIADPDAAGLDLSVTLLAANGSLSLGNTAGLTFTQGDGSQDNRLSFSGSLVAINAALSELTYRSYPGFTNAFDRITVSVNDNGNSGIGVNLSDTEVLFVSVGGAVNQSPVAINDSFSVAEESTLNATSVLANDNDPDFTVPLTAVLGTGPANAASFTLNGNGSFTYVPNANFSGSDTFTYRAVDALGGSSNTATVVITVTDVNDPPVAVNDSFTTPEDQPITNGAVLTNDTDIDNSIPLSTELVTGPASASNFTFSPNGSFSYTPRADFNGVDRFTYRVVDALGGTSNIATVSLTVTPVNDAPIARNDGAYTLPAGGTLSITGAGVLINDTDVDTPLANLTASLVTGTTNGTVTLNPNGSFSYRPTGSFTGGDSFTYQVSDGSLTSNLATVTISVGVNGAPVAIADSFTLGEDGTLTVGNVLSNDVDTENNVPISATIVLAPPNAASFTLNSDGTFSYQPRANFSGVDTFVYQAIDSLGAISTPATVTFNVTAVNDAPVAANDTLSVSPGATLTATAPGILANDTDIDSPSLAAVLVTPTTNGVLSLNPNGSFTYRPNVGFSGTDSFTYRANDGSLNSANTATVSLVVTTAANTIPIANPDTYTLQEDQTLVSVGTLLLANDIDPDNNVPLTVSVLTQPGNGSLAISGSTFDYVPNNNFAGTDSFTYVAIDSLGGVSNPATVTLSVTPVNDAPTVANDAYSVATTASLNITAPGILANDTDVDSPSLTATLVATAANGTLSFNADGSFVYTPNTGFSGVDSFTYRASDGNSLSPATATVNITVASVVNNAPSVVNDAYTVATTASLNITAPGVLQNDTDTDSPTITATLVATAANGTLSFNADGSFVYTPNTGFSGVDSFTYRASDGNSLSPTTATVNITVASVVNSAPTAVADSFSGIEDTAITIGNVLTNDTDTDGNLPLVASLGVAPTNALSFTLRPDGSFSYLPNANFNGTDTFTYVAVDSLGAQSQTATVTFSVAAVNDAPIAANNSYNVAPAATLNITLPGVLVGDTDPDGDALTATLVTTPTGAASFTLNPDGSFTYVPQAAFSGTDSFTYQASDGTTLSNLATVSIFVTSNLFPTASPDTFTTQEDTSLTIGNVLTNDTDTDGNIPLTASVTTLPSNGSLSLSPTGDINYVPNPNFSGTDSFTYVAIDSLGGTSAPATVTLSVTPTNDLPTAANDTIVVNAGTSSTITAPGVLANDTDPDANPLTASLLTNASRGTVTLNSDGSFVYTPNTGVFGLDSFTYVASDGTGNSAPATVTIDVNGIPIAVNNTYTAAIGSPLTVGQVQGVLSNDSDPDGDTLSASVVGSPAQGVLTLNSNGSFVYTPNVGASGIDTFTYRATDGFANATATVTVSLRTNSAPVAIGETYRVGTNGTLNVALLDSVLRNDSDPDTGTTLSATLQTTVSRGSLSLNSDGTFTYVPQTGFQGTDSFVYRASDGITVSGPATVTLSVANNTPPVANNDTFTAFSGIPRSQTPPGVRGNDTDANGDNLTVFLVSGPPNGSVSLNPDGSFVYTANTTFQGADTFVYRAFDGIASSTATVTMSVTLNSPPTANPDLFGAIAGETLTVTAPGVLANDSDPEGTLVALGGGSPPANGDLVVFNSNGSFTYVPRAGFTGVDSFTYRASDNVSEVLTTVTISVAPNAAPVANADTYDVNPNNVLVVPQTQGVLANDTDPNIGQALSASVVTSPLQGSLTLNPNGSFSYTPGAGATGSDSFTYRVTDGSFNSTATVTIAINTSSTPPTAVNDGGYTVSPNGTLTVTAGGVLTNDTDPDGDVIRATLATNPGNGSVTLNPDGSFQYRPNTGFQGTDSFTYQAIDGLTTSTPAVVFVTVGGANAAPVISLPGSQLIQQNSTLTLSSGLSVADPDAGTSPIQVTLAATNGTLTLGSLTGLSFSAGDGTGDTTMTFTGTIASINSALTNLQFAPTTGFTGATQITLTANDQGATGTGGAQTGSGTVSVNVATGATLVTNINPGSTSSSPTNLLSFGNTVYFSATDPTGGTELWSSDGTGANTRRVADINVGTAGSAPANLVVVGNTLYYTATTPTTERELWRTDLTAGAGATLVGDIRPGIDSSNPQNLTNYANTLFFVATDGTGGARQLWRVDATGNPVKVSNTLTNVSNLAIVGSTLFFTAGGGTQLWKVDTPTSAPVLVSNVGASAAISNLTAVGNRLFFTARDAAGVELWSSDGTSATTSRVADLNPGTGDSNPSNLVVLNGTLYFFARDNSGSFKLFRSTAAGGVNEVATLPSTGVAPSQLTVVGSRLFFTVDVGTLASPSVQLWSSDGGSTASLVRDLNAGNDNVSALTSFNGALFFVANDGTGFKVFRSDGSSANTVAVSGAFTTPPAGLTVAGNRLLFAASDGPNGGELWTVG